jgi:hypothetical protein
VLEITQFFSLTMDFYVPALLCPQLAELSTARTTLIERMGGCGSISELKTETHILFYTSFKRFILHWPM